MKIITSISFLLLTMAAIVFLSSCGGTPLCVGGFGSCGYDPSQISAPGTPVAGGPGGGIGGNLGVTADNVLVTVGGNTHFHAGGGMGPYTYEFEPGTVPSGMNYGDIGTDGTYTAPSTLPNPNTPIFVSIRATDSRNIFNHCTIVVTSG